MMSLKGSPCPCRELTFADPYELQSVGMERGCMSFDPVDRTGKAEVLYWPEGGFEEQEVGRCRSWCETITWDTDLDGQKLPGDSQYFLF